MPNTPEAGQPGKFKGELAEIKDFFGRHRQFLEKYAGDSSIRIEPSPEGLGTFAIDLENGTIFVEPSRYKEKGWDKGKIMSSVCHEFEHFREMKELLAEDGGDGIWQRHIRKIKANRRFGILDNCYGDVKMDWRVASRAPVLTDAIERKYREDLFPENNLTDQPKHLQFAYALKQRAMLTEELVLDLEVQAEIDKLETIESNGVKLLEYATRPDTPMSMRLRLQARFLEPIYERLFKEDVEEKRQENKGKSSGDGNPESGEGGDRTEGEPEDGDEGAESNDGSEKKKPKGKSKKTDKKSEGNKRAGPSVEDAEESGEPINPEDYFRDEYDDFDVKNIEPIDYSSDKIEKKIKDYIESQRGRDAEQAAREAYARAEGVSWQEIKDYQAYFSQLENLENPETGEQVIEELRKIFRRIIAERRQERYAPKHPLNEGEILIRPAEAVAAVMSGENEPEVWESQEKKDLPQELYGDFDVVLVGDRSGSMNGAKAREQRQAIMLALEALKEFCDELEEARSDLKHDLNVRSEVWSFGGQAEVKILKPLSEQLTEKQRVSVYKDLATAPGSSTMDFLVLEKIRDEVTPEEWQKIKDKKLRKVVIVFTDGESDDPARVKSALDGGRVKNNQGEEVYISGLRDRGIAVVAIGVTASGRAAETTYSPDGQTCESIDRLAVVLADLLKEYLKDLLIKK
ncbi:MAG: VWA domain-containing protein [Patescibacteria group bacterium]